MTATSEEFARAFDVLAIVLVCATLVRVVDDRIDRRVPISHRG